MIKARDKYFTIDDMTEQLPNMENIDNAYIDIDSCIGVLKYNYIKHIFYFVFNVCF